MLTRQRLQHQPHVVHSDHRTRLLEFILQLGLAEHLSTFAAEWGSRSFAEIRLPDKTRLRFWADPCTASIKMQVLDTQDSSAIGVSFFDLTKSEVEKIRREIERKINKALPKPTRIPKKGTK